MDQVSETVNGDPVDIEQVSANTDAATHQQLASSSSSAAAAAADSEEQIDIDLADPEVQKAAVFIQSGFKGFRQRKISQGLAKVHYTK